jgi:hydroxymethylglutaryl-CoA reductase (NADPH)
MPKNQKEQTASIPMRLVGPVAIHGTEVNDEVYLPLASFETPLWPSTERGARVATLSGGINAMIINERMTRSILFEADSAFLLHAILLDIQKQKEQLQSLISGTSRFAKLIDIRGEIIGCLLYLRIELLTGDAAGHNMTTLAADHIMTWMLSQYSELRYVSISGNYCTDKKVSAVNGILGRGKHVIAEVIIPRKICMRYLKTTPEKIVDLNIKKNLLGSIAAGSLRTANAHFANILLGFFLATGQDAANIIEGSQGMVYAELRQDDLYFSVSIPNMIVGSVGNGKSHAFVEENLRLLGCLEKREPGMNARRLAIIAAAAVLSGELSLLAAQTKPGELMKSHIQLERKTKRDHS